VTQIAQERLDLGSQIARGCLMRLGERRTALALVVHHVVSDGWSTNLWSHEFSELYTAHVLGRPPRLPELPVQFADHARWERGWLRGDALHAELGHWRRRLGGAPRELDLPVDRDRPPAQTYRGDGLAFGVPAALVDRLRRVAHAHNATLFMAALTAWHVLLHLWTGDDDVTVGTPVAHRNRVELEPLLGCFVNFVLVPARVEPSATLGDLLRQVRETSVWAFEHQDAPFCELVRELAPGDDQRPPLFSVMLELANAPGGSRLTLPGLSLSELRFEHGTSEFELNMVLAEAPAGGLTGWLLYRDLFDRSTVERLVAQYRAMLTALADDSSAAIGSLARLVDGGWAREGALSPGQEA